MHTSPPPLYSFVRSSSFIALLSLSFSLCKCELIILIIFQQKLEGYVTHRVSEHLATTQLHISHLPTLSPLVNGTRCEGRLSGRGGFSLGECEELMTRLKDKYPEEYKVQLALINLELAYPLFGPHMHRPPLRAS